MVKQRKMQELGNDMRDSDRDSGITVARVMRWRRTNGWWLVPGGVYDTSCGVLDMGFGTNEHGVVIPTGGSKIRGV
jgi:hypothetical protein